MGLQNKLATTLLVQSYIVDPDATTPTNVAWVPSYKYDGALFQFLRVTGTSDLTMVVLANTEEDGSGTDIIVATKTFAAQPDAAGDTVVIEVGSQDIADAAERAGLKARGLSLNLAFATDTDDGVAVYVLDSNRGCDELTADVVA